MIIIFRFKILNQFEMEETDFETKIKLQKMKIKQEFDFEKVFVVLYLHDGMPIREIFSTLEKAQDYIFKEAMEFVENNGEESDEQLIKDVKREMKESYTIRVVYGIDSKKDIFWIVQNGNYCTFGEAEIVTNDIERWKKITHLSDKDSKYFKSSLDKIKKI